MSEWLVELEGVAKSFGLIKALDEVYLKLTAGKIAGLVGPSGAGKTTLIKIAGLLIALDKGRIIFNGEPVTDNNSARRQARGRMAMVRQKPVVFSTSVAANVALGLKYRGVAVQEREQRVARALELVELTDAEQRHAPSLSGGEAQRVAFARAIVVEPRLLLLDEFTANLDPANVAILEKALADYIAGAPETRGALVVSHNLFQAKRLTDELAVLMEGKIVEIGETGRLFEQPENKKVESFLQGDFIW